MAAIKLLFFLTAILYASNIHSVKIVSESEYLTYCATEKRELCKWTPNIYQAREAAHIHLIEFKEHQVELWERKILTPSQLNIKRPISVTKLQPAELIIPKNHHF